MSRADDKFRPPFTCEEKMTLFDVEISAPDINGERVTKSFIMWAVDEEEAEEFATENFERCMLMEAKSKGYGEAVEKFIDESLIIDSIEVNISQGF